MFEPENDIERLLMRASAEPAERPAFARALLDAEIVLVLVPEGGDPIIPGTDGNAVIPEGAKMVLPSATRGEERLIPFFTARSRAQAWYRNDHVAVPARTRDLFARYPGAPFVLNPGSDYGKDYTPPPGTVDPSIDMKTPVRDQVNSMDAVQYFTLLCELMKTNPPNAADAPIVAKMAKIGIVPGKDFDASQFNADFAKRIPQVAFDRIMLHFKFSDGDIKNINGWGYTTKTGLYGTNYIQRALVTAIGLGANRPDDAIYPTSLKPVGLLHRSYMGSENYTVTFKKGQTPPVNGFWSLTMYDANYFFVANPINRYSISARQDLKVNADGSTTLYIQNTPPSADKVSNWLPAPKDKFVLMFRLYWPKTTAPTILDGSWVIPEVKKVG